MSRKQKLKVEIMPESAMKLLPCAPNVCQECATDHAAGEPHNQQSLYYQYHFRAQHGRWPTWKDAMAHCSDLMKSDWTRALAEHGITV